MSLWLKSLIGYMLIVSVVTQMIPNQKYEQYVKLFTGFLLIVLIIQPLLKIGSVNTVLENKIAEFVQEQEELEAQIGLQSESFKQQSEEMQQENHGIPEIEKIERINVEVNLND